MWENILPPVRLVKVLGPLWLFRPQTLHIYKAIKN